MLNVFHNNKFTVLINNEGVYANLKEYTNWLTKWFAWIGEFHMDYSAL